MLSRYQKVVDGFGDTPNPARTGSALPGPSRDAGELSETYFGRGGSIINLTSVHGFAGYAGHAAYAATKGAIIAFTRELAIELAPHRIRVNAIGPGLIEVPRYFATMPDYTREKGDRLVPWGRVGLPIDVAQTAVFLASDAADFITGQVLYVDGGTTARLALRL
ncbi:MAG: SDR family oxidoreductase [Chloroflexi bacterium]|nr:SDR family oxidoreductase [Chloroflexota bacterium]